MNKIQQNKLAMYGSVEELLKATTETSGIAGLPAKLTVLTTKLAEIDTLAGIQTQPTTGETSARDGVLNGVIATTLQIAGIVGAYAHEHTLPDLGALVDVQRSDFDAVRLGQRPLLAQRVHDAAAGVVTALANPAVTADTLAAFQTQIDTARAKLREPRMTIIAKRGATSELAGAFRDLDALLTEQIDRLVLPLQETNPGFYAQYQAARSIVNVPGTRSAQPPATAPAQPATNATTVPVTALVTKATAPTAELKAA